MSLRQEVGESQAWRFASSILTFWLVAVLAVVGLLVLFPGPLVELVTRWNTSESPDRFAHAVELLPLMAPALIGLSLGSVTYMILNADKKFFWAAFGDAAVKLGPVIVVGTGFYLAAAEGPSIRLLGYGVLLGGTLKLACHLWGLRGGLSLYWPRISFRDPGMSRFLWLALPLLVSVIFAKFRDIFSQSYVLSAETLEAGVLSANSWGRKLPDALRQVIPYAIQLAMLPFFCNLVDQGDRSQVGRVLTRGCRLMNLLFLPLSAGLIVLSTPLVRLLYEGSRFTPEDARLSSVAAACYAAGLSAWAIECLLMQGFFAVKDMVTPALLGIVTSSLSVAVSYLGVVLLGWRGGAALAAVALGLVASRMIKVVCLLAGTSRHYPIEGGLKSVLFPWKIVLVALLVGLSAWTVRWMFEGGLPGMELFESKPLADLHRKWVLLELAAATVAGVAVGMAGVWAFKVEESRDVARWVLDKIQRRTGHRAA